MANSTNRDCMEAGSECPTSAASSRTASDQVFQARHELINRIGDSVLKDLLDGLQRPDKGPVIKDRERQEVLQAHRVIHDQVTCLVDMVLRKGEQACSRFLSLLKEIDPSLSKDIRVGRRKRRRSSSPLHAPQEEKHMQTALQAKVLEYKNWICSQYRHVQDYNTLTAENVPLTERYIELQIVQNHRHQEQKEEEICSLGEKFFKVITQENYSSTTVDQFFSSDDDDIPQAVILQGHSGFGKSFTVQKIMLDWASDKIYQDQFMLILHLRCKDLNVFMSGNITNKNVVDLVLYSQDFTELISQMLKDFPNKILFLVDGFDEVQFQIKEISDSSVKDPFTPAPVGDILRALLTGSILHNCFLLVTTRSTATNKLGKLLKRTVHFTEIMGFSEKGIQEYFEKFYQSKQVSENALRIVRANETLFTSCSIPVICWIVCTIFKEQGDKSTGMTDSLGTTTYIFIHFVFILLDYHCQDLGLPVSSLLKRLGKLALEGMQRQSVLFDKEVVSSIVSDTAKVPFLGQFSIKKIRLQEMFSFMHKIFQEFFTALHYTLNQDDQRIKELLGPFQKCEAKFHLPVIKFLFGLSNRGVRSELEQQLQQPYPPSIQGQLEEWILQLIREKSKKTATMLFILHCLYELHEKEFVSRAMETWGEVKFHSIPLTRTDCWVLLYCLQCCPTIKSLEITKCNITAEKLSMLQPALSKCKELGLTVENLQDDDVDCLILAMAKKKMTELSVVNGNFTHENTVKIIQALCRQESVGKVLLSLTTITDSMTMWLKFIQEREDCNYLRLKEYLTPSNFVSVKKESTGHRVNANLSLGSVEQFFDALSRNKFVTSVHLSVKDFTASTMILCLKFMKNTKCHELTLRDDPISASHVSLDNKFRLDSIALSPKIAKTVLSAVHEHNSVTHISLSVTTISASTMALCFDIMQNMQTCLSVRLTDNPGCHVSVVRDSSSIRVESNNLLTEVAEQVLNLSRNRPWTEVDLCVETDIVSTVALSLNFIQNSKTCYKLELRDKLQPPSSLSVDKHSGTTSLAVKSLNSTWSYASFTLSHATDLMGSTFTDFINMFRNATGVNEKDMGDLTSSLVSLPNVEEVVLHVNQLTESWAVFTIDLIQKCPRLQKLSFEANYLLEEAIRHLRMSSKPKNCTVTLSGLRSSEPEKALNAPRDNMDMDESLNKYYDKEVVIKMKGDEFIEENDSEPLEELVDMNAENLDDSGPLEEHADVSDESLDESESSEENLDQNDEDWHEPESSEEHSDSCTENSGESSEEHSDPCSENSDESSEENSDLCSENSDES